MNQEVRPEWKGGRLVAVIALGKIGPAAEAAVPALTAMQEDSIVGRYAKEALKWITGK